MLDWKIANYILCVNYLLVQWFNLCMSLENKITKRGLGLKRNMRDMCHEYKGNAS